MKTKKTFQQRKFFASALLTVALALSLHPAAPQNVCADSSDAQTQTQIQTQEQDQTQPTWISRISEWFESNFLEFLGAADILGVIGVLAALIVEQRANGKHKRELVAVVHATKTETRANTVSNDSVLAAVNALIDQTNALLDKTDAQSENNARLASIGQATLEILASVYAHSKNVPQAVKDLVCMKYVAALKTEQALQTESANTGGAEDVKSHEK